MIDLEQLDSGELPFEVAISCLTLAELAAGPHATEEPEERARRQDRLQRTEAAFDPLPFDAEAARSYVGFTPLSRLLAASLEAPEQWTLLIAATAHASSLPLYTPQSRRLPEALRTFSTSSPSKP